MELRYGLKLPCIDSLELTVKMPLHPPSPFNGVCEIHSRTYFQVTWLTDILY